MGWVLPAQVWQSSMTTHILRQINWVLTLRMGQQPWIPLCACCISVLASCFLFPTNKWQQAPSPAGRSALQCPTEPLLPWLRFCPHLLINHCSLLFPPTPWKPLPSFLILCVPCLVDAGGRGVGAGCRPFFLLSKWSQALSKGWLHIAHCSAEGSVLATLWYPKTS